MFSTDILFINTMIYMSDDFERLMSAAKILRKWESQAELARQFSVDEQVITNWKSRGLPRQRILELARKIGCNPFWLEDGQGEMVFHAGIASAEHAAHESEGKYQLEAIHDPILDDLAELYPEDAEVWRVQIRAAAAKARRLKEEKIEESERRSGSNTVDPPLERRRTA